MAIIFYILADPLKEESFNNNKNESILNYDFQSILKSQS